MALERLEAVVLKLHALGDTSRIAVLYSRERGIVRTVAKGARQPKSKFAGTLEPLARVSALLYFKENRDLQLLSAIDLVESFAQPTDFERLAHAQAAVELVDRLVWGEEEHAALYDLLIAALGRIARDPAAALAADSVAFQVQAAGLLGYRPVLNECAGCGREPGLSRAFAPAKGGILCERCAAAEATGLRLSGEGLVELRALLDHDWQAMPARTTRSGELLKVMEVYLQTHFQRFAGFRSLELLRSFETPRPGRAG
jgi:DNA repair protein RecO (recombination protein O)